MVRWIFVEAWRWESNRVDSKGRVDKVTGKASELGL